MAKKEAPATTQAEYDKAWEEVKSGKQPVPSFDDMSPTQKEVEKERERKERIEALRGAREAMGNKGKPPGMKKGGLVGSASKRADGIATKGKTKGRII